jgi:hypothetical protein
MICHALKANGRPCHAYGSVLERGVDRDGTLVTTYSHTCRHHQHFFDGDAWKKKYLSSIWYQDIWHIPHHHIEYVISSGAVEVTQDDVAAVESKGDSWYLFVLLARHVPAARREWNPSLWEKAQFMIWRRIDSIGPVSLDYIDLRRTICEPFAQELALCLNRFPRHRETSKEWWLTAVKLLLILGDEGEILKDPQLETCLSLACRPELPILKSMIEQGEILNLLLTERAAFYANCVAGVSLSTFREELLSVTWHPSRAIDWCMDFDGENPFKK